MFTLIAIVIETVSGPLLLLVWLARTFLLFGAGLFLLAAPFAHKAAGTALLYLAQAFALTFVMRFLRRLRARVLYGGV
jgi:hypothetical protein